MRITLPYLLKQKHRDNTCGKEKPQDECACGGKLTRTEKPVITFHLQEARSIHCMWLTRWISFFRASFQGIRWTKSIIWREVRQGKN